MKFKKFIPLIVFVTFFIVVQLITLNASYRVCVSSSNKILEMTFKGIIADRFEDKKNHLYEKIKISQGDSIITVDVDGDKSHIYDSITIGDSIYKEAGSMEAFLVRDGIKQSFRINFDCEKRKKVIFSINKTESIIR